MRADAAPVTSLGSGGPFAFGDTGRAYQRLFDSLPVPALLIDDMAFVHLANPAASDFLNLSGHGGLQRRSVLHHLDMDSRQRLVWRLQDRSGQDVFDMHGVGVKIDSSSIVACDLSLVHLDHTVTRQPMSLLVLVDRSLESSLRQSQSRLRRQTRRLSDVIWASQTGVWEWELPTKELSINERFAQMLGEPSEQFHLIRARDLYRRVHPQDRHALRRLTARVVRGSEQNFNMRLRLAHRGGGWVWVVNRGRVLERDDLDRPLRLAGAIQDISAEVERETALKAAKEQAEETQRLRSQWLANVGHEVRTPLNSVLGLVQLMQEQAGDERQREFLQRVAESAQLLRETLDDMLDSARLEAGELLIERVPIDIHEWVRSVMAVFIDQAQRNGVALSFDVAPVVPAVLSGDPLRLRQLVNNLISNALKFTARGSVEVSIDGRAEPVGVNAQEPGFELTVRVKDTGIGIDAQHLPRLFTPYYQTDASTSRRYGGTGLGLSICQRLAQLMGGQVGVDSTPGHGSLFWFTVRLGLAPPNALGGNMPAAQGLSLSSLAQGKHRPVHTSDDHRVALGAMPANTSVSHSGGEESVAQRSREAAVRRLRHSLLLQDHASLQACRLLMAQVDSDSAKVLRRVLRLATDFDFDAALRALDELPMSEART